MTPELVVQLARRSFESNLATGGTVVIIQPGGWSWLISELSSPNVTFPTTQAPGATHAFP